MLRTAAGRVIPGQVLQANRVQRERRHDPAPRSSGRAAVIDRASFSSGLLEFSDPLAVPEEPFASPDSRTYLAEQQHGFDQPLGPAVAEAGPLEEVAVREESRNNPSADAAQQAMMPERSPDPVDTEALTPQRRHDESRLARILRIAGLLSLASLAGCVASPSAVECQVTELMSRYHELGQFTGAWLVADADGIVAQGGLGEANREWSIPNTVDTKFALGSITKQFTAALVLSLVDEGLIRLEGTISEYLPEYRPNVGQKVTIHHLLTHSGGFFLPRMSREEYDAFFQKKHTNDEIIEALTGTDLRFEPGSRFSYSSAGYMVLGAIIERVTGLTYGEALRARLLDPLGMSDTGIDDNEALVPRRAAGYQTNFAWGNAHYKYYPNSFSAGALYSTVQDLYTWDQALRHGRILSDESRHLLFERHIVSHRGYYGYGWFVADQAIGDSSVPIAFHAGDTSGFSAIVLRALDANQFIALLTNQEGTHYYDIAYNLLGVLNGVEAVEPKEYVADILRRSIYTEGRSKSRARYAALAAAGLDSYNTDESELIELGYDLLYAGRPEDAIFVLETTAEIHPTSYDAQIGLGEANAASDRTMEAIASYERALALKPGDESAKAAIEQLRSAADGG